MSILAIVVAVLASVGLIFAIYLAVRFGTHAFYRSKLDFFKEKAKLTKTQEIEE